MAISFVTGFNFVMEYVEIIIWTDYQKRICECPGLTTLRVSTAG
jgi:hypothetical protein